MAAGLSQEALAERSGLSVRGISDLERGARSLPRPESVRLLADALGLDGPERTALLAAARPAASEPAPSPVTPLPRVSPLIPARGRLPIPPTRLVARDRELERLVALLSAGEHRLITITGPGGVGKTRLALAAAERVAALWPDGVAFVDLAPLDRPEDVPSAIGAAIGAPERRGQGMVDAVTAHLVSRRTLILLDNCEHVLAGMTVVARILAAAPGVAVLATSRERLHLRGERETPLLPMSTPPVRKVGEPELTLASLADVPAIRLFMAQAEAVAPELELTAATAGPVAEICRAVDGLPLASEIAAAQLRHLSPSALATRLEQRLAALAEGQRDLPDRQRALASTIAWSYELLAPAERALFRRLSVFSGGWDLAGAAAAGSGARDGDERAAFGLVAALADRHLIQPVPDDDGEPRWRMLETVRAFALDELRADGEEREARDAHLAFVRARLGDLKAISVTSEEPIAIARFDREVDNVRTALSWAIETAQAEAAAEIGITLIAVGASVMTYAEVDDWLGRVLDLSGSLPAGLGARLFDAAAWAAHRRGESARSISYSEQGLALATEIGDDEARLGNLLVLGSTLHMSSRGSEGLTRLREALDLARALGDRNKTVIALSDLVVGVAAHDLPAALAYAEEAAVNARSLGATRVRQFVLSNMGVVKLSLGDFAGAEAAFTESLEVGRVLGTPANWIKPLANLATLPAVQADMPRASGYFCEALLIFHELGDDAAVAETMDDLALFVAARRPVEAAQLQGAAKALRERVGAARHPSFDSLTQEATDLATAGIGPEAFARIWTDAYSADLRDVLAAAAAWLAADAAV